MQENVNGVDFYISSQDMSWINSINRNSEDKNHEEVANY
jgi:hypothetical protein